METKEDIPVLDDNWATFENFWLLYPRKVAKLDARKAWLRLKPAQAAECLTSLVGWRKVWMARGELEFVPHAATWLNGERWEDELPATQTMSPSSASHVMAQMPSQTERTAMPDHVRALLASLRK
jgi:DNA replication protein DnaC